jgi:hypothetical protein
MSLQVTGLAVTSHITGAEAVSVGAVIGTFIVGVLILAFVIGARLKEREEAPDQSPLSQGRDAWSTPPSTPGHAPHGDAGSPQHYNYLKP